MDIFDLKKALTDIIEFKIANKESVNDALQDILDSVETIMNDIALKHGWQKWGDGKWREETACSLCGYKYPGLCGHQDNPNQVVLRGLAALAAQRKAKGESK